MTTGVEILIGVIGVAVACLTFFAGRQGAAKSDGAAFAELKIGNEYIRRDIGQLTVKLDKQNEHFDNEILRIYDKLAEHEKTYHKEG